MRKKKKKERLSKRRRNDGRFLFLLPLFFLFLSVPFRLLPSTSQQPPFAAESRASEALGSKKVTEEEEEAGEEQRERAGPSPLGHSSPLPAMAAAAAAEAAADARPPPRPLLRTGLLRRVSAKEEAEIKAKKKKKSERKAQTRTRSRGSVIISPFVFVTDDSLREKRLPLSSAPVEPASSPLFFFLSLLLWEW